MSEIKNVKLPLALQQLIIRSNELLNNYRNELMNEIDTSSRQMMQILKLDEAEGWKLDIDNMVFTRHADERDTETV